MGTYRVIDMGASLVAQLMIGVLSPASYVSYNLLAILCCASLLPLTLTKASQPETPKTPRLRPALAWVQSPLAVAGVIVAGLTSAAFRMVGPIYGKEIGLEPQQIGYFLAAFVAGGALAQYPTGWLADKYDRRWVLIAMSVASIAAATLTVAITDQGPSAAMMTAAIFGFTSFPIYSVSAAHANDFASQDQRVELSAALMFFYAIGAIASPLLASSLITAFGPASLFVLMSVAHLGLIIFGLLRMNVRPTMKKRTSYIYMPRTSFIIGKLMRRNR
jgi:MFS family permease